MKRILCVCLLCSMVFLSGCSTTTYTTSDVSDTSNESSFHIPSDDEYLTSSELNSYANTYKINLQVYNMSGMCQAVIDDFEKNGEAFKKADCYSSIRVDYENACEKMGILEGAIDDVNPEKISNFLNLDYKLDEDSNILVDYKNVFNYSEKVYLTWEPIDENGNTVKYNKDVSFSLTFEIDDPIEPNESGKAKFETIWNNDEVKTCKLTNVFIIYEDRMGVRFNFE